MSLIQKINEMQVQSLSNSQKRDLVSMLRQERGLGLPEDEATEFFAMVLENIAGFEGISTEGIVNDLYNLYIQIQK